MKMLKRITLFSNVLKFMLIISVALACGMTTAQEGNETGKDTQANDEFTLEEVVVTGSRIPRRDYESSSPIVTVKADTFVERSNIGLESTLNQMPQFTPAGTASMASAAASPTPSATAAPGAATANLRGLGTNRTLVLVDGKRVQPINAALVVDLNTIPAAAIESVEVITGGAAAVYGADAIAGVVNLILRKDFKGATFDAQYGITQEGDGEELQLSALLGAEVADGRGNVMMGFNYADRKTVMSKDRDFVTDGWKDPGTVSFTGNDGLGTAPLITVNGGSINPSYVVDQNGHLFDPKNPVDYTGPISYESGYKISPRTGELTYFNKDQAWLQMPLTRYSIFGSGSYNITDKVEFYMDLRFSENQALAIANQQRFGSSWALTIPYNQQYDDPASPDFGTGTNRHPVPAEVAAYLNTRVRALTEGEPGYIAPGEPGYPALDLTYDPLTSPWTLNQTMTYLPPYRTLTTGNVYQVSGGLRGEFGSGYTEDWTWELYYSHGKSSITVQQLEGFTNYPRSQELYAADQYGKGFAGGYAFGTIATCESGIPVFGEDGSVIDTTTPVSQDCADYMTLRMNHQTFLEQNVFEANMQGSLFELPWSGMIKFAAGVDYRKEDYSFNPDSGFNAHQDFINVVGNVALPVVVNGSTDVKEVYGELLIPILKDLPLIKSFTLEPGYRISDYNLAPKEDTYKVMGDWEVIDWIRFRGGVQYANRAPNIAELFQSYGASAIVFGNDACSSHANAPDWGNKPDNPNRLNVQTLCQYLMVRDGAPANYDQYVPGGTANDWAYFPFGPGYWAYSLAITGGNPDLDSESADTRTLGMVIDSPFEAPALKNLRISVDYYDIEVEKAIAQPEHDAIYQQCLTAESNPLIGSAPGTYTGEELAAGNPYCDYINREYVEGSPISVGIDRNFEASYLNMGGIFSKGYDIQIDWNSDFSDIGLDFIPGRLGVNLLYSKLDKYAVSPFAGAEAVDYTGTNNLTSYATPFDYKMLTTFSYINGAFSGGLRWTHLPSLDPSPTASADVKGVDSYDQFDLFGSYVLGDNWELRFGIDNLLYAKPKPAGATYATSEAGPNNALGTYISSHDTIGRRFYLAAKVWF